MGFDSLPTLSAARISLRWLTEDDAHDLFAIFSDPEVTRYWSHPPFQQLHQASALVSDIHDLAARGTLFEWGVVRTEDDRVIGTCTLASIDRTHQRAEIGFTLGRDHWGQGYISEALDVLLGYAFDELGLHRIEADMDPRNRAAIRAVERQGFQREGLLPQRWFVGGQRCDSVMYGLLAPAWRDARGLT